MFSGWTFQVNTGPSVTLNQDVSVGSSPTFDVVTAQTFSGAISSQSGSFTGLTVQEVLHMQSGAYIDSLESTADTLYIDGHLNVSNLVTVDAITGITNFGNFTGGQIVPTIAIDGVKGILYATGASGAAYFKEIFVSTGSLHIGENVVLSSIDGQRLYVNQSVVGTSGVFNNFIVQSDLQTSALNSTYIFTSNISSTSSTTATSYVNSLQVSTGTISNLYVTSALQASSGVFTTFSSNQASLGYIVASSGSFASLSIDSIVINSFSGATGFFDSLEVSSLTSSAGIFASCICTGATIESLTTSTSFSAQSNIENAMIVSLSGTTGTFSYLTSNVLFIPSGTSSNLFVENLSYTNMTGATLHADTAIVSGMTSLSGAFLTLSGEVVVSNLLYAASGYVNSLTFDNIITPSVESNSSILNIACAESTTSTVNIATTNSIQTVNIGTVGAGQTTVNIGGAGDIVNVAGTLVYVNSEVHTLQNPYIILNEDGENINNTGIVISKTGPLGASTGAYILVNSSQNAWKLQAGDGPLVVLDQNVASGASVVFSDVHTTNANVFQTFSGANILSNTLQSNNAMFTSFSSVDGIVTGMFSGTNGQFSSLHSDGLTVQNVLTGTAMYMWNAHVFNQFTGGSVYTNTISNAGTLTSSNINATNAQFTTCTATNATISSTATVGTVSATNLSVSSMTAANARVNTNLLMGNGATISTYIDGDYVKVNSFLNVNNAMLVTDDSIVRFNTGSDIYFNAKVAIDGKYGVVYATGGRGAGIFTSLESSSITGSLCNVGNLMVEATSPTIPRTLIVGGDNGRPPYAYWASGQSDFIAAGGPYPLNQGYSCAYNGSLYVMGGFINGSSYNRALVYSTNGVNWAACTVPTIVIGMVQYSPPGWNQVFAVAWNKKMWVCGATPVTNVPYTFGYSYDGMNWYYSSTTVFTIKCNALASNGKIWVAGSNAAESTNSMAYSYDGINWTGLAKPMTYVYAIAWNGIMFIAVGSSVMGSYDGLTWFLISQCRDLLTGGYNTPYVQGIAWNGRMWVAVGAGTTYVSAYSYDGLNWFGGCLLNFMSGNNTAFLRTVSWNGSFWVVGGAGDITFQPNLKTYMTSTDGINFTGDAVTSLNIFPYNTDRGVFGSVGEDLSKYITSTVTTNSLIVKNSAYANLIAGNAGSFQSLNVAQNGQAFTNITGTNSILNVFATTNSLYAMSLNQNIGSGVTGASMLFSVTNSSAISYSQASIGATTTVGGTYGGNLLFCTSNQSSNPYKQLPTEKMRLTDLGRLGIGTSSPNGVLDARGTVYMGNNSQINIAHDGINGSVSNSAGNTLFYGPSARSFIWHVNAVQKMSLDASGNLVLGGSCSAGSFYLSSASFTSNGSDIFINTNGANSITLRPGGAGSGIFQSVFTSTSCSLAADALYIDSSKNIGIGTTSPAVKLHVSNSSTSATSTYVKVTNASNQSLGAIFGQTSANEVLLYNQANASMKFATNNVDRMTIEAGGNVSIVNSLTVSSGNVTGGGIILADDGDIVDMNDGYCTMRFSNGLRIYSANKGGSSVITLGSNGNISANGTITASSSMSASSISVTNSVSCANVYPTYITTTNDNRTLSLSSNFNRIQFGFTTFNLNNSGDYADYMFCNTWSDTSGGWPNALVFAKGGSIRARLYGGNASYSNYKDFLMTDQNSTNVSLPGNVTINSGSLYVQTQLSTAGYLGVGTSSPGSNIEILYTNASNTLQTMFTTKFDGNWALYLQQHHIGGSRINYYWKQQWSNSTTYNVLAFDTGNVGIGTTNPAARLHVQTSGDNSNNNVGVGNWDSSFAIISNGNGPNCPAFGVGVNSANSNVNLWALQPGYAWYRMSYSAITHYWYKGGGTQYAGLDGNFFVVAIDGNGYSISCPNGGIYCPFVTTFSDMRIKKNIKEVNDALCLQIVNQLNVYQYDYECEYYSSATGVVGFIAQQVQTVDPNCVNVQPDYIPNINQFVTLTALGGDVYRFVVSGFTGTSSTGSVKFLDNVEDSDKSSFTCQIVSVEEGGIFTVKASSQLPDANYFCYGTRVDNFLSLNKDRIFAYGIGAIQELVRENMKDKLTMANLKEENQSLKETLSGLLSAIRNATSFADLQATLNAI